MNISLLIPAYNPGDNLITFIEKLSRSEISKIVVVDDGSKAECSMIFESIKKINKVIVLHHSINIGKGAALKYGLDYIYGELPGCSSVITADSDGQHSIKNILELAKKTEVNPDSFILGSRNFDRKNIPVRSMVGNIITKMVLRLLLGMKISDTQTGLRGIPRNLIPLLLEITYNRYEFEMEVLLLCKRMGVNIQEVPIETIYMNNNIGSHFNPVVDSMKIYFVLFRYFGASIVTVIVDFMVFIFSSSYVNNIMLSTFISRFVALFVNYAMVRTLVFKSREKIYRTFPKYVLLVMVSGFISGALVYYFTSFFKINIIIAKMISESILYLANFVIQKDIIFGNDEK
jgi:glycosyltransferase involved in cell wall biosynthesis